MVKAEKVNRKKALQRVRGNIALLRNGEHTLKSVYDIIFSHPDFTFLNVINNYGYDEITYEKAKMFNECFACYFKNNIKTKSKYVGLLLDNSKEWIYSFYGLLLCGYTPVLLSTANDYSEINIVVDKLHFDYLITDKKISIPNVNLINPFEIKFSKANCSFDNEFANEIVFLSSGTSGEPKVVFYNGEQVCNQIYNAGEILESDKNIGKAYKGLVKHLIILPFYHIFGLFAVLLWFMFFNIPFVLPSSLSPKSIKQACLLAKPTHIFAVPLFWESIDSLIKAKVDTEKKQKELDKAFKLSSFLQRHFNSFGTYLVREVVFKKYLNEIFGVSIRFCVSGGAFLKEDTLKTINLLGYPLVNGYGSTEIGITSLCESNTFKKRLSLSIGKPFRYVNYRIDNGSLKVNAPSSSRHIIDGKEEIILKDNDWIDTRDLVEDRNGAFYLLGRDDEIIIQGDGENLSLPLMEKSIVLPTAKEFALVEQNKNIVLIASYNELMPLDIVIKELNSINNKHISSIYYTNIALPKANSLKTKRNELKQLLANQKESFIPLKDLKEKGINNSVSTDDKILEIVISSFKKAFPEMKINPNSHFYNELGGNSLKYFMLINIIEEKIEKQLQIDYDNPPCTPASFVPLIEKALV